MPFIKLKFNPGVDKEGTNYENTIGWYDTDKVRFRQGQPEKIGGWLKRTDSTFAGTCRALLAWTSLTGIEYIGLGTSSKLYVEDGGVPADITPIRASSTINANPFNITGGSAEVIVTDTAHGAVAGDYVTYSGATSSDSTLTAAVMNSEYRIHTVTNANTYVVTMSALANGSDATEGASSVTAAYQINSGLDTVVGGTGWGADTWGSSTWGTAAATVATDPTQQVRLWSLQTFGEDLLANIYNGGIYQWDTSAGTSTRAVNITSLAGSADAPTICRRLVVAAESRHLLALGCDPTGGSGTQDTLLIRWCDAETLTDWTPDTENTAGSLRLNTGSEIITAIASKRDTLVWTDISLNSITYVGPPFFFGTRLLATNISIIGPNAAIQSDDIVFWMGWEQFYVYDGSVKTIPCSLRAHVFDNINREQASKTHVGINRGDSEIWWFYPTTTDDIDSYVVFNYDQRIWYHGTMVRTAWIDRVSSTEYPVAAYTDGNLYHHELGYDDGSTTPVSAIAGHAESSMFEAVPGDGYQYGFASALIPDVTFGKSGAASPAVVITITPRDYPGKSEGANASSTITRTGTEVLGTSVEEYTERASLRVRGRQLRYRIENSATGVFWRDGTPRLDVRPDGRQ